MSNGDAVWRPDVVGSLTTEGHGSIENSGVVRAAYFDDSAPGLAGNFSLGI